MKTEINCCAVTFISEAKDLRLKCSIGNTPKSKAQ